MSGGSGDAAAAPAAPPRTSKKAVVELHAYDISGGLARSFAPMLGMPGLEAVWHTSVVVRDPDDGASSSSSSAAEEVFFGYGVQRARAGTTPFGAPLRVVRLGETELDAATRDELLADLSRRYQPQHYRLTENNCNHFASEWAEILCGVAAPGEFVHQARDLLSTPMGQMIAPMLAQVESMTGRATATGFNGGGGGGM